MQKVQIAAKKNFLQPTSAQSVSIFFLLRMLWQRLIIRSYIAERNAEIVVQFNFQKRLTERWKKNWPKRIFHRIEMKIADKSESKIIRKLKCALMKGGWHGFNGVVLLTEILCRHNLLLSWRWQQTQRRKRESERKNSPRYVDYCTNAGLIKVNTCERIQTKTNGSEYGPMKT